MDVHRSGARTSTNTTSTQDDLSNTYFFRFGQIHQFFIFSDLTLTYFLWFSFEHFIKAQDTASMCGESLTDPVNISDHTILLCFNMRICIGLDLQLPNKSKLENIITSYVFRDHLKVIIGVVTFWFSLVKYLGAPYPPSDKRQNVGTIKISIFTFTIFTDPQDALNLICIK